METAVDVVFFEEHRWTAPRLSRAAVTNSQERVGCDPFAGSSEREV